MDLMNHSKKIYHSLLETVDGYNVWLVDGAYIRKNINENFVEYDSNIYKQFIPKKEFWIDIETNPREYPFFITHLLTEIKALNKGFSKNQASSIACRTEKRERLKHIKRSLPFKREADKKIVDKVHFDLLQTYSSKVKIWLIDGKIVRDHFLLDYAEGGHDLVYDFIPEKEIWIEKILTPLERKFIMLHELHERFLMSQGLDYPHAHHGALIVEDYFRDHPQKIEDRIFLEIKNNDARC